jgi:hypothetical protein
MVKIMKRPLLSLFVATIFVVGMISLTTAQGILCRSVLDWPTGVTVYKPEKCYSGFTLFTPYRSGAIFMIDMSGRVVHTWKSGLSVPKQKVGFLNDSPTATELP